MLLVAASPELDHHDVGPRHPERPARVQAALAGIDEAGLRDAVVSVAPRRATEEELSLVHPLSYLEALRSFCEAGGGAIDPDTMAAPGSWDTALLAAGAALEVVDALGRGEGDVAFVAARPPGHHALAAEPMGFCLLNNIAVAAATLAERGERVLIVDWDVHHGNGTQAIFWDDPRVLYVSTHQWPLYPGTGRVSETGGPDTPASPSTCLCRRAPPATSCWRHSTTWRRRSSSASSPPGCSYRRGTTPTGPTPWPDSISPRATSPTSPVG